MFCNANWSAVGRVIGSRDSSATVAAARKRMRRARLRTAAPSLSAPTSRTAVQTGQGRSDASDPGRLGKALHRRIRSGAEDTARQSPRDARPAVYVEGRRSGKQPVDHALRGRGCRDVERGTTLVARLGQLGDCRRGGRPPAGTNRHVRREELGIGNGACRRGRLVRFRTPKEAGSFLACAANGIGRNGVGAEAGIVGGGSAGVRAATAILPSSSASRIMAVHPHCLILSRDRFPNDAD